MTNEQENNYLRAIRAIERLSVSLKGIAPGIPRLLEDMRISPEEHYFLLYGITLLLKVMTQATERAKQR